MFGPLTDALQHRPTQPEDEVKQFQKPERIPFTSATRDPRTMALMLTGPDCHLAVKIENVRLREMAGGFALEILNDPTRNGNQTRRGVYGTCDVDFAERLALVGVPIIRRAQKPERSADKPWTMAKWEKNRTFTVACDPAKNHGQDISWVSGWWWYGFGIATAKVDPEDKSVLVDEDDVPTLALIHTLSGRPVTCQGTLSTMKRLARRIVDSHPRFAAVKDPLRTLPEVDADAIREMVREYDMAA